MHVSAQFMRLKPVLFMYEISSDNFEEFAIPCMIPETCKDLGRFTGGYHECYMYGLLPIFHAWNVHVPCMESGPFYACSMHGSGIDYRATYVYGIGTGHAPLIVLHWAVLQRS